MNGEKQVTHTNTQQEPHNTRHDKNNTTIHHTTRQEQHMERFAEGSCEWRGLLAAAVTPAGCEQASCKKIDISHTHTPTENNTPDTDTHAHDKNNTPNLRSVNRGAVNAEICWLQQSHLQGVNRRAGGRSATSWRCCAEPCRV